MRNLFDMESELWKVAHELLEKGHRLGPFEPVGTDGSAYEVAAVCERCGALATIKRLAGNSTIFRSGAVFDGPCQPHSPGPGPDDGLRRPIARQALTEVHLKKVA